jgi:hypothetical protein
MHIPKLQSKMSILDIYQFECGILGLSRLDVSSQWLCEALLSQSSDGLSECSHAREDELL